MNDEYIVINGRIALVKSAHDQWVILVNGKEQLTFSVPEEINNEINDSAEGKQE
jgi:hypothetical protein